MGRTGYIIYEWQDRRKKSKAEGVRLQNGSSVKPAVDCKPAGRRYVGLFCVRYKWRRPLFLQPDYAKYPIPELYTVHRHCAGLLIHFCQ